MICSHIWHKYNEWYFKIVYINWGNFEKSRVVFMPNITYNSCYYLFILQPEKFSHLAPCVYFRRVVSLRSRGNWFRSSCFRPSWFRHWARSMYFSQYFSFPNFSFSFLISWFQNVEIFPPFLRNSCDGIIWWFWVTIVTVIFTCRYIKLSGNTSALSQSNCRNFSGSRISKLTTFAGKDTPKYGETLRDT